jgi:hypothetical protein
MHPAELDTDDLLRDCDVTRTRRSGPGGQHRNKVETAIVLHHRPTGIRAEASERRSQSQNHDVAAGRLRIELALAVRSDRGEVSGRWRQRVRGGRLAINRKHDDFPAILAEALDTLAMHAWDAPAAAGRLDITPTQLVKLLKIEPRALEMLNRQREAAGVHRLK